MIMSMIVLLYLTIMMIKVNFLRKLIKKDRKKKLLKILLKEILPDEEDLELVAENKG